MGKRLFFVLSVLFLFSFLFVQVTEAGGDAPPAGTYTITITKIGFYRTTEQTDPDSDTIITLPSPMEVHVQIGGEAPNINDLVYTGSIPNGSFLGVGFYYASSTIPNVDLGWEFFRFDDYHSPSTKTFTENDRKLIQLHLLSEYSYVTVESL